MNHFLVFIISFLATYLSTFLFRKLALAYKILDLPGGRKIHTKATPLLGGAPIFLGLSAGLLLSREILHSVLPILIGATLILVLGLINDIIGLRVKLRLFFQLAAALIVTGMGVRITFLPQSLWGNIAEIAVTVFWLVGVTNAYNYLDGLDGLAAGSAVINLLCCSVILYKTGQHTLGLLVIILVANCLGFLPFNLQKNKIFLGEAGSTFLGFMLAGIALLGNWAEDNIVKITIPVLILGIPIFDMIFTTIMRIREKKVKTLFEWLEYSDRDHFHHYLVDLGFGPQGAVVFIYLVTFSLGISAIMVSNDSAMEAFLTLSQAAIILGVVANLILVGKRHKGASA